VHRSRLLPTAEHIAHPLTLRLFAPLCLHCLLLGVQPGNVENEPFVKFLEKLANSTAPPCVFSMSYGDDEPGVTESYAKRASQEFQMGGARGITFLAAAGDSGAGCAQGKFVPTFPASCPYVTGVGGTTGGTPGQHPTGESAVGLSGGGFSNYFTRPAYQVTCHHPTLI